MECTMRQVDSRFRVGAWGQRGAERWMKRPPIHSYLYCWYWWLLFLYLRPHSKFFQRRRHEFFHTTLTNSVSVQTLTEKNVTSDLKYFLLGVVVTWKMTVSHKSCKKISRTRTFWRRPCVKYDIDWEKSRRFLSSDKLRNYMMFKCTKFNPKKIVAELLWWRDQFLLPLPPLLTSLMLLCGRPTGRISPGRRGKNVMSTAPVASLCLCILQTRGQNFTKLWLM